MATTTTLNVLDLSLSQDAALGLSSEGLMKLIVERNLAPYAKLVVQAAENSQVLIDIERYFSDRDFNITPMADELVAQVYKALVKAHEPSVFVKAVPKAKDAIADWHLVAHRNFKSAWYLLDGLCTDHISTQTIEATRAMFAFGMVSMYVGMEVMEVALRHGKDLSADKDYIEFMTGLVEPELVTIREKFVTAMHDESMGNGYLMMRNIAETFAEPAVA